MWVRPTWAPKLRAWAHNFSQETRLTWASRSNWLHRHRHNEWCSGAYLALVIQGHTYHKVWSGAGLARLGDHETTTWEFCVFEQSCNTIWWLGHVTGPPQTRLCQSANSCRPNFGGSCRFSHVWNNMKTQWSKCPSHQRFRLLSWPPLSGPQICHDLRFSPIHCLDLLSPCLVLLGKPARLTEYLSLAPAWPWLAKRWEVTFRRPTKLCTEDDGEGQSFQHFELEIRWN